MYLLTPVQEMTHRRSSEDLSLGESVSVLCPVCHVFPPLVSLFGLFPVLV